MDKMKFWKKDDDLGDLGSLDDFSLDGNPAQGSPHAHADHSGMNQGMDSGLSDIPHDADPGAMGDLPPLDDPSIPGMHQGVPTKIETLEPSAGSQRIGSELGLDNKGYSPSSMQGPGQHGQGYPAQQDSSGGQQMPGGQDVHAGSQGYSQGYGTAHTSDGQVVAVAKEIEIMHAKIDAIRSSLDSINQRLASLERIASGDQQKRYSW